MTKNARRWIVAHTVNVPKDARHQKPAVPDKVTENFLQVTLARGVLFQTVGPLPEEASANGDAKENN